MIAGEKDDIVELHGPPVFLDGDKVRACKFIRNDGTFPGKRIGDALIEKGDVGYVREVGTFLQRYYIYSIDFIDRGMIVGMRAHELEMVSPAPDREF
ncbi:MAG: nitrogen fixation protein NifZ [Rhizomicrobium sp.]